MTWERGLVLGIFLAGAFSARGDTALPEITIRGRGDDLNGVADSATQGTVGAQQIGDRVTTRPAEIIETVPGMIITQHAGGGKANQYYLRGFNLDHGTDFAFYVDGVPINMPTHAHGQGYSDLNWLIPELVKGIEYQKGVYYANQGDFGNTGSASIDYYKILPHDFVLAEGGSLGYGRVLAAASPKVGEGHLLSALELQHYDGAWAVPNAFRKLNGMLKYSLGGEKTGASVTAQGYYGIWNGADQIPQRAIDKGLIDRFGALDTSPGGATHRYSLYGEWHTQDETSSTKITAYAIHYGLDLFSNFSYFIDQTNSDEFVQYDNRVVAGARAQHTLYGKLFGRETEHTFGLQARQDWIDARLDHATNRVKFQHISTNKVSELNVAPWFQSKTRWLDFFRTEAGIRADGFYFDVNSDHAGNSGNKAAGAVSPKLSLIFGPWNKTEYYLQGGFGFRSNDARGVFTTVAPDTGAPSRTLAPIVHARGAEAGVRSSAVPGLNTTFSLWTLANDSDTFFAADTGSLVDSDRSSLRTGVEWTNFYSPANWLTIDADFCYSWAFFTDGNPSGAGIWVPQAVKAVLSGAVTVRNLPDFQKFFGSLRFRYFGPRPLIEDNSQQSAPVTVFNLLAGYDFDKTWTVMAEVLNLFNSRYNDAEYFDVSRLKGEAPGPNADGSYNDHMVHAGDPRSVRVSLVARF